MCNLNAETSDFWWLKGSNTGTSIFPYPEPVIPITINSTALQWWGLFFSSWGVHCTINGTQLVWRSRLTTARMGREKATVTSWSCRGDQGEVIKKTCLDLGQCTAGATTLSPQQAAWELRITVVVKALGFYLSNSISTIILLQCQLQGKCATCLSTTMSWSTQMLIRGLFLEIMRCSSPAQCEIWCD